MSVDFHHHQLSNGLTVIGEVNSDAHTAAVGFFVKTGSRDEDPAVMGISHFLEHMMFKGTDRRTADDVNREFDELGANYNAYTTQEDTVFFAQVLPQCLPPVVDLLADILRPSLRGDDFEMEKKVILEEIGMYEDQPQWRLQDALIETHFRGHPLAHRVLGTQETVGDLNLQQMQTYFDHRYSADNIIVAAAGNLQFDQFVQDITVATERWVPTGAMRQYTDPQPIDYSQSLVDPKLARHYGALIWPGPASQDDQRYAAAVLADVLGDTDGSRLYWNLIDPGLADEADISLAAQDQLGSFVAFFSCDPERAKQVEAVLLSTLDDYVSSIDVGEIERVKNKIATDATVRGENPAGRMRGLGHQWTYLGRYIPLTDEIRRLMDVTVDDVRQVVTDWPFRPRTIMRLGPIQAPKN